MSLASLEGYTGLGKLLGSTSTAQIFGSIIVIVRNASSGSGKDTYMLMYDSWLSVSLRELSTECSFTL
jgi:hypothetical protein